MRNLGLGDLGFLGAVAPVPVDLLLDLYPNAAGAFSLRQLRTTYTGPVVRVRRSSDNTEQDFTASQVSDGTLATFCSATNGFVRTWYDQSGNARNATQSTNGNQPRIVNAGILVTKNGKPAISIAGTGDHFMVNGLSSTARVDYFFVKDTADTQYVYLSNVGEDRIGLIAQSGSSNTTVSVSFGSPSLLINGLSASISDRNAVYLALNGYKLETILNGSLSQWSTVALFNYATTSWGFAGTIQEWVVYSSNQSSTRAAIEANINAHYAIY